MDYADAIRFLYGLERGGVKLGLDRMHAALERRGHPEEGLRVVHVAGTNGKGSVSATIAACLSAAGHRTGLYTSPHLHRFGERIRIDGHPASDELVAGAVGSLSKAMAEPGFPALSFFEAATVLALEIFRDRGCDAVVLEVGLGGRLDATNVVEPLATVITRVAFDHRHVLGATLAHIAQEKAGILKRNVPLVCSVRTPEALEAIEERAAALDVPVLAIDRDFTMRPGAVPGAVDVLVGDEWVRALVPRLEGSHQVDNLACAVAALVVARAAGLEVSDDAIARGVAEVDWPGRLEHIDGRPGVLLDCAHNADGCAALAGYLASRPAQRRVLLFGAMADKDLESMMWALDGHFDAYVFAAPPMRRAADPMDLVELRKGRVADSVREGIDMALETAGPDGLVVVAGSIFLVAEARALLLGLPAEPFIGM